MSNFLLSQTSQACWHHIKELVADGVRELVGSINSLKSDRSNNSRSTHRYEDLLESSMRRVHSDMVKDGEQFIEDYYANFIEKTLPQMCKLYPVNTRVVKMAIFLMNRHFRMQKETFCAHLKGYGFRKLRQLCEASNKRKAQPDGTLGSSGGGGGVTEDGTNSGGGSSSSASRGSPEVLVARQQYCDTHLAAAVGSLGRFISFTVTSAETATAEHTPEIFLQEVCTLSFKTDSLFTSVRSGETVVVVDSLHLRNNMSVLLTHLTEISAMLCTLAASHCMELSSPSPPTGNTSAVEASTVLICVPPVDRIAVAGTDCDLRVAFRNLLALYQISVAEISKSVRDERLPLSSTRRAELLGKVAADLAKFTTSILPYLLYLDVVYASLQCCDVSAVVPSEMAPVPVSAPVSALECLTRYSTQSAPVSIQQKPVLFLLPSDLLHHLHSEKIISLEIISRTLGLIARAKTAAFYENCKGLTGMKECVSRALLSVIGRIIFRNQEFLGIDMSVLDDDGWYKDSSIRLLVKSNLSETLSSLISTLLVSL